MFALAVQAQSCSASSPAHTVALVELYGGDACSRCLAAERWLAGLTPGEQVVPVALYGESRRYGEPAPATPRRLTLRQRMALVYAPQVLLQGREFRDWGTAAFQAAVAQINAAPALARVDLEILSQTGVELRVRVRAEVPDTAQRDDSALFIAAYEHRGTPVVFEWIGPLPLGRSDEKTLPLPSGALPARSGAVAFVQDRRSAQVLQALMLPACP